jgi:hypothetical protein
MVQSLPDHRRYGTGDVGLVSHRDALEGVLCSHSHQCGDRPEGLTAVMNLLAPAGTSRDPPCQRGFSFDRQALLTRPIDGLSPASITRFFEVTHVDWAASAPGRVLDTSLSLRNVDDHI